MKLSKLPYKGTRDFFPSEKRRHDAVFYKMKSVVERFGYESYDGPLLESLDLYRAKSGEEIVNDQVYSFIDKGKREVAIRPEMTPTLARMISLKYRDLPKPIRWYSTPNLMRYENPQRGRLREHWQFNCDIFGASSPYAETEIIQIVINILQSFGATEKHFSVLFNDRRIPDYVFRTKMNCDEPLVYKLYKIVDKSKKISDSKLMDMLGELALSQDQIDIFLNYISINTWEKLFGFLEKNNLISILSDMQCFYEIINTLNLMRYLNYDPQIMRGLDYYTGIVFEVFDKNPENPRAICGGGAYANLLSIFDDNQVLGVGFGLGDVTLIDFLTTNQLINDFSKPNNDLLITFQTDSGLEKEIFLADQLRKNNFKILTSFEQLNFKKAFILAEKYGVNFIAFLGENELNHNTIEIKNINTRKQYTLKIDDIGLISKLLVEQDL